MSDPAVIRLISNYFVPVALNRPVVLKLKDETGDFVRAVYSKTNQFQGLWLVTWDGRLLASTWRPTPNSSDWPKRVLADLRSGMDQFGSIPRRRVTQTDPLPYRGVGVQPDGSVSLAVTDKIITRPDLMKEASGNRMAIDSVRLNAAEWASLAPPDARIDSRWTIPAAVGRQFHAILNVGDTKFRYSEDVMEARISGRVASVRNGVAYLTYTGRIVGDTTIRQNKEGKTGRGWGSEVTIVGGVGAYQIRTGQMLAVTWVGDGVFRIPHANDFQAYRFGVVVEWRRADPLRAGQTETMESSRETKVALADSTPEDALKTFLLALAAHDKTTLRAVALPHDKLEFVLNGPLATTDELALLKARLDEKPIKRLKAGDPVKMPNGESRVIKPDDVREGRVVLWPDGTPIPSRLENVDGHWKVFAAPYIAARK